MWHMSGRWMEAACAGLHAEHLPGGHPGVCVGIGEQKEVGEDCAEDYWVRDANEYRSAPVDLYVKEEQRYKDKE